MVIRRRAHGSIRRRSLDPAVLLGRLLRMLIVSVPPVLVRALWMLMVLVPVVIGRDLWMLIVSVPSVIVRFVRSVPHGLAELGRYLFGGIFALAVLMFYVAIGIAAIWLIVEVFGPSDPATSPSPRRTSTIAPITWTLRAVGCSDGWQSFSIGHRGACSHHGGVVYTYEASNGLTVGCPNDTFPPMAEQLDQQVRAVGRIYCVSIYAR